MFCRSAMPGRERRGPQSSATLELVPRWSFRPASFWSRPDRSGERPASVAALRAAVAEFPHRDAELPRLVSQVLLPRVSASNFCRPNDIEKRHSVKQIAAAVCSCTTSQPLGKAQSAQCSEGLAEDGLWLESATIHMVRHDLPLRLVELKFVLSVSFKVASGLDGDSNYISQAGP